VNEDEDDSEVEIGSEKRLHQKLDLRECKFLVSELVLLLVLCLLVCILIDIPLCQIVRSPLIFFSERLFLCRYLVLLLFWVIRARVRNLRTM